MLRSHWALEFIALGRRSARKYGSAYACLQCENNVEFLFFCCSGGCSGDDRAFAAKAMILMDECRVDICTVGNLAMAVFCLRFMM